MPTITGTPTNARTSTPRNARNIRDDRNIGNHKQRYVNTVGTAATSEK
jgi:hypothetical protein